jgi:hypothetical protein
VSSREHGNRHKPRVAAGEIRKRQIGTTAPAQGAGRAEQARAGERVQVFGFDAWSGCEVGFGASRAWRRSQRHML